MFQWMTIEQNNTIYLFVISNFPFTLIVINHNHNFHEFFLFLITPPVPLQIIGTFISLPPPTNILKEQFEMFILKEN